MPNWTKEQESAIYEKDKNIIVSAGAGSGKTAVLTERVKTHLKSGISIDRLLILTFTNAAAAEMKERIRKEIKKIPTLKEELDKIDSAYITTFDAYALDFVKKYSSTLNISNNIQIADNSFIDLLKEKFLNEIFDDYYKAKNELFLKFIDDFCLKDDKEMFYNLLSLYKKMQNMYNKREYLSQYVDNYYKDSSLDNYINGYVSYIKYKEKEINDLIKKLGLYVDGSYITKIEDELIYFYNSKTYSEMKNNITHVLPRVPKGTCDEAKNIKKSIVELLKEIENLLRYESENQIKETIFKTKDYAKIIIEILLELDNKLDEFKRKNDIYEFIDISNIAINLLKENEKVREELKNNYYEILIDEYQDTNDLQEMFISLISKNNVYMVGDIKQSIYRFRNTNPALFKEKYRKYSDSDEGLKIDLNKNFRSRNEVLTGINKMFDYLMNEDIGGAEYRDSHRMIFGNTSYNKVNKDDYNMEILNYIDDENYTKEEIEIFTIAHDIKNKIKNRYEIMDKNTSEARKVTYSDFAILLDRSSSFDKYKQIFEYLNIPLNIYRDKSITNSVDIMLIKNIYTLIIKIYNKEFDNEFKYAFVSISRSYLLETLDNIILEELTDYKNTVLYNKCLNLSEELLEITNYELINKIIKEFNIYEKMIKVGNINEHLVIIDSIKKIAHNMDSLGYSPFRFIDYLKEVIEKGFEIKIKINGESNDAVKIMTIHGSKGLEFPICYFSGLSKEFNISDLKQKIYFSSNYGLVMPYFDNGLKTTILKTLLKQDYLKEEISEKLRLFYVALTRAREKIIIVTSLKQKEFLGGNIIDDITRLKYVSFKDMIDSLDYIIDDYIINIDNNELGLTKKYNLSKKNFDNSIFLGGEKFKIENINVETNEVKENRFSKNVHKLISKEEIKNIKLGVSMHKLFENFDFKNPNYDNLDDFELSKIKAFIKTNILDDAINIYKEYEFIYEKDENEFHGIIDLLIIKKDKNIIVDYKLKNTNDKDYMVQLSGYKKYIEDITGKHTDIYLYSILDEKLIKED